MIRTAANHIHRRAVRITLAVAVAAAVALASLAGAAAAGAATLTVVGAGSGSGTVTSAQTGTGGHAIDCTYAAGSTSGICVETFGFSTATLTAAQASGSTFTGWTSTGQQAGTCTGGALTNPCETGFLLIQAPTVTATFQESAEPPKVTISPVEPQPAAPCLTGITATSACFSGTVNPEGSVLEACRFEYLTKAAYEKNVSESKPAYTGAQQAGCEPDPAGIGGGTGAVPVQATTTTLEPDTEYRVRLLASKAATGAVTAEAAPFATTAVAPSVRSVSALPGGTAASLVAEVNPNNQATTYRFEYGLTSSYGSSIPLSGAGLGAGYGFEVAVAYVAGGLVPETEYHFRIVATNASGSFEGLDQTFTTEATPPSRAFELVSTGEKEDANAISPPLVTENHSGWPDFGLVAASGERLEWDDRGTTPNPGPTNGTRNIYLSSRNAATGWSSPLPIAPPGASGNTEFILEAASRELGTFVFTANTYEPATGTATGYGTLIADQSGSFATIYEGAPLAPSVVHVSPDGSRVFFDTNASLLPEDTHQGAANQVYEWTGAGGLRLAGVDSAGRQLSPCGAALAGKYGIGDISTDGARVLMQSPDPGLDNPAVQCRTGGAGASSYVSDLYLREGQTTTEISKPPAGVPDYGASFVGMNPSGTEVFFVTETALTADKTTEGAGHADLYRYDTLTGALTRLSRGPAGYDDAGLTAPGSTSLSQAALVSGDGTQVYFTALGQLVPGEGVSRAVNEQQGTASMYRWNEGEGVSFVATVEPGEYSEGNTPPLSALEAAVTPDGSDLVFDSTSRLSAYASGGNAELYRYDAASGRIDCVSCSPAGLATGGSEPPRLHTSFSTPTIQQHAAEMGGLSEDGSTVAFASTERLLPAAANTNTNKSNPIYDIYVWHDGQLTLLSTGQSVSPDFLLGASASGRDVSFATSSQLLDQDGDGAYDIYDARVGGGFPEAEASAACVGGECRGAPTAAAAFAPASSATYVGPGNLVAKAAGSVESKVKPTRAAKLARALKACRRSAARTRNGVARRRKCESRARARYGRKRKRAHKHPKRSDASRRVKQAAAAGRASNKGVGR